MAKFEFYRDKADEARWRLKADNGEIVAQSSEGYTNMSDCKDAADLFAEWLARDLTFEVYEAKDGYRWRCKAENGRIIAVGESYTTESDAHIGMATAQVYAIVDVTAHEDLTE